MSLTVHTKKILGACALLLLAVSPVYAAQDSGASVEIYDSTTLVSPEGILPSGVSWNQPLRAGDMVLPRQTSRYRGPSISRRDLTPPQYPAGSLQAPLVSDARDSLQGKDSSTAGVMLLQGMKNALQQAGENTDLPPSDSGEPSQVLPGPVSLLPFEQTTEIAPPQLPSAPVRAPLSSSKPSPVALAASTTPGVFSIDALVDSQSRELDGHTSAAATNDVAASSQTPQFIAASKPEGLVYEQGQEPKTLSLRVDRKEPAPEVINPTGDLTLTAREAAKAFDEEVSIFGAPVVESNVYAEGCVPHVTKWTRSCQESGYPANFEGQVVGESRRECPAGNVRDVWLSNSCAQGGTNPLPVDPVGVISDLKDEIQDDGQSIDAVCGSANGLAALVQPSSNLCLSGKAGSISGQGPWRWTCSGLNGGVTVSCAAPLDATNKAVPQDDPSPDRQKLSNMQDGRCGPAHNVGTNTRPVDGLCASGTSSRVNGEGPWRWACSGSEGGQAMACLAPKILDGVCGAASREGTSEQPTSNLCDAGYASAVTGEGPWNWTCSGLYGGEASMCQAIPRVDAVCGPASMTGHRSLPTDGLCSVGKPVQVLGTGPWHWQCHGEHGGAHVTCHAPILENGKCGAAHGSPFMKAPEENLCETGTASRVTGVGPWDWACMGKDGGTSETCTAAVGEPQKQQAEARCGESAEIIMLLKPEDKLCAAGEASEIEGEGPWTWSCADQKGMSVRCSTLAKTDGVCGEADNRKTPYAPERELCKAGSPSAVRDDREKMLWHWKCRGFMGGETTQCVAPMAGDIKKNLIEKKELGRCGSADGHGFAKPPMKDLCDVGEASTVLGEGPWTWTCRGKSGDPVTCDAEKNVDALCGQASGSIQRVAPQDDLCAMGKATPVRGKGPWLWSCIGSGGGNSVSCSASSEVLARVDGICGVAANAVMTQAPKVNLCDMGTASNVYGEGPWTWTCSGKNGGVASTCQTSNVLPKAPVPLGPRINGLCGYANGRTAAAQPREGLCSTGTVSAVSGDGPWNWSCLGENGGMTVSCTAPLIQLSPISGVCGKANGAATSVAPHSGLCSAGIASAVSGKGPWTWSCSGTNGGGAVSCVAPRAGITQGGMPSSSKQALDPQSSAPSGKLVTPQLSPRALPPTKVGDVPNLTMSKKMAVEEMPIVSAAKMDDVVAKASAVAPQLPYPETKEDKAQKQRSSEDISEIVNSVIDGKATPVASSKLNLHPDVSVISFERGSDQLDKSAEHRLEELAGLLKTHSTARITMVAYSMVDGEITPRQARRLSLQRALSMRDFLTAKGIASSRVDLRPMGANVPSGDMDRVDIRVN